MLICKIAENIEMLKLKMPPRSNIRVIEGVRKPGKPFALEHKGIKSSPISNHYFGSVVRTPPNLRSEFGLDYAYSVGAANIVVSGMAPSELFRLAVDLTRRCRTKFGSITLHMGYKDIRSWIHISNDPFEVYGPHIATMIKGGPKYTYTKDGGKSFHVYEVDNRKYKGRQFE